MLEPVQRRILKADTYMDNDVCQMNLLNSCKTGFYSRRGKSVVRPLDKIHCVFMGKDYLHSYQLSMNNRVIK